MKRDKPGRSSLAELSLASRPPPPPAPEDAETVETSVGERPTVPAGRRVPPDTHARMKMPEPPLEGEVRGEVYAASRVPSSRPPPSKESDRYIGVTIDNRYKVEEVIGEGGMGVVYRCRHKIIDKIYAIKILRADFASDHEATERFVNEAKAASAIGNVHIVDVIDFGDLPDESTYFVMEFLDGQPLAQFMGGKPLPSEVVFHIVRQIAEALHAAHRTGIIHRDLKPDNVYVVRRDEEEHFIKILDFGIAKIAGRQNKITRAGTIFGTPHYMSPEQAKGSPADQRTDLYSLGIILYEMVTGRVPFDAESPMGILSQHLNDPPPPIRDVAPDGVEVSAGLEEIIRRCLAKEPEGRYASMEELLDELDRVEQLDLGLPEGAPIPLPPFSTRGRAGSSNRPPPRGRPARSAAAGLDASPAVTTEMPVQSEGGASAKGDPSEGEGRSRRSVWPYLVALLSLAAGVALAVQFVIPKPVLREPAKKAVAEIIDEAAIGAVDRFRQAMVVAPVPKPPAPDQHSVAMVLFPIDAEVYLGEENLGMMPVSVTFDREEVVDVIVRRRGFWPKIISLDRSLHRIVVQLRPLDPNVDPSTVEPEVGFAAPADESTPIPSAPQPGGEPSGSGMTPSGAPPAAPTGETPPPDGPKGHGETEDPTGKAGGKPPAGSPSGGKAPAGDPPKTGGSSAGPAPKTPPPPAQEPTAPAKPPAPSTAAPAVPPKAPPPSTP